MNPRLISQVEEATSRTCGLILRAIEMAYGTSAPYNLIRRTIFSALGDYGLAGELKRIFESEIAGHATVDTSTTPKLEIKCPESA